MYWDERALTEVQNASAPTTEHLRVLVAAENRLVAEALMFTLDTDPKLEAIGYAVNGWEALDSIWALNPDVVVVGPQLAGLDPLGFCQFTHELFPDVLLIMLCERLVPAAVESAYAVGVSDCLPLARTIDQLLLAIEDAYARRQTFKRGRRRPSFPPTLSLVPPGDVDARA